MNGISVIICTFNGKGRLLPVLEAISRQNFEKSRTELLVVDNCSNDGTDVWLSSITDDFPGITLRIVKELRPGLNHARLRGVKESRYDIVLFCDDDNLLAEDYLSLGGQLLESHPAIGALGGCGVPALGTEKPDWFDKRSHSYAVGAQAIRNGKIDFEMPEVYGAGAFFRKKYLIDFFEAGFDWATSDRTGKSLVSGGDVEMCYIVKLSGGEIWFDDRLVFHHMIPPHRLTWEYYGLLKVGISSSIGCLLPYVYIFENRKGATLGYYSFLCLQLILNTYLLLGLGAKHFIFNSQVNRHGRLLAIRTKKAIILSLVKSGLRGYSRVSMLKRFQAKSRVNSLIRIE